MELKKYSELSGIEVADANRAFVTANIAKAQIMLETALGFPLATEAAEQNLYTERGKAQSDYWSCSYSDADLLPADEVDTDDVYRLFSQATPIRTSTRIDPCTQVTKVKLVHGDVTVH